ncbi:hypothetical protein LASUN_03460 [Lentilactobacillus sunkii]|jgi:hypothetical protein|uniref:Uncharacterized protein n=1 Tax=Lentilactobacillus sunkii TaxID=481719 RepID=A0A1E7XI88_9LACO|nr:hypothetical protein [Lentilactobacillus sunkii]OFA12824.1 hypothetical protein LASUN_03460 [Lentilactobacillus sunkii]
MTLLILTIVGLSAFYYFRSSKSNNRSSRYQNSQDPHAYAYARDEHPEILDKGQTSGRPRKNIN